ncbi:hypothetical protein VCHA50P415_90130 [Vibrio chagasii]|nr:hypothetical protein VCHA27O13_100127 [Vibrio chagasii]CAH6795278.1 hypothetical protein VCHA32P90_100127 [Vibrio chagasii]CAH6796113.1 hypothetical protein VCHA36O163_100135 [Vibrio chagasii]CAH6796988.1 hypothetical protein VCHA31O71_100135 [Vibrio chagasii]CAH6798104.1 hypothetical protein VCHA36O157_110037 [Vibrio chagasii]
MSQMRAEQDRENSTKPMLFAIKYSDSSLVRVYTHPTDNANPLLRNHNDPRSYRNKIAQ